VVAVEVVFGDGLEVDESSCGCFVGKVCHATGHFLHDVDDDGSVPVGRGEYVMRG
jgi:hypothetical protein